MKIESVLFCILYAIVATGVMYVGYNIITAIIEDLKRQDKNSDK